MPRDPMRPVTIKLDPDLRARIQRLATARQRTPHWLMREAISEYVTREEQREALRASAQAAWEAYAQTGQHVTQTEADRWLAQLEAGADADPPPCHL
jgi:predicted transcriptional regulator